jgi:crotonobetainyl-CoA:carnitine CoA-transferase CaiB-like acyl-CoA transferase
MSGPLSGIRIIEFSQIIAAPFAGSMLSDMGAEVIKIEPPTGDPWRYALEIIPGVRGYGRSFFALNRGKKGITLDLKNPKTQVVIKKLVEDSDVMIINSRPDVPKKLKLDYESIKSYNPAIIYCSNTAFGRSGPDSHRPGYDLIAQAISGLMSSENKTINGVPQPIQSSAVADFSTGLGMAWSICAALFHREKTGLGQKIETTLLGSALSLQNGKFFESNTFDNEIRTEFKKNLNDMKEKGSSYMDIQEEYQKMNYKTAHNHYYRTYQVKNGIIAVGCLSEPLRKKMADTLGITDIRFDEGYDQYSDEAFKSNEKLVKIFEAHMIKKTISDWLNIFDKTGVPAGEVKFVEELTDNPQVIENDLVKEIEHPVLGNIKMVGPMVKMSETPLSIHLPAPELGEHSNEVLKKLGFDDDLISEIT